MSTPKQRDHIKTLMGKFGYTMADGSMTRKAMTLPFGPVNAQLSDSVESWINGLGIGEASEVIETLKGEES